MKIIRNLMIVTILGALVIVGGYVWRERKGIQNLRACKLIRPGVTVPEVIGRLGPPVRQWTKGNEDWMAFEAPMIAAGLIKIKIEKKTNRVLTLYCTEDGPPLWEVKN